MRFIKLFFISIIVLFLVVTFIFALFPSHIRLARVIAVNAPEAKTAAVINDLKTWDSWNRLIGKYGSINSSVSSPSSGRGAFLKTGSLQVTITGSSADSIITHWQQGGRKSFTGSFHITRLPVDSTQSDERSQIIVEWSLDFHFRWYPWEKLGSMFYDKLLGPEMEKSLLDLKNYIEKIP
jgi:hypothetical protein